MFRWGLLALIVIILTVGITVGTAMIGDMEGDSPSAYPTGEGSLTDQPSGIAVVEGEELTHEFGSMELLKEGKHVWVIRNDGDTPLRLKNGGSDCSCTIASIGKEETATVEPQKTTQIELTWNPKVEGEFGKSARINTSDPKRPTIQFKIHGMVYPSVMTLPKELNFDLQHVPYDKVETISIAAFSTDKPDLAVTGHKSSKPAVFDVRTEPMTEEDRKSVKIQEGGLRIMIDIKPGLPIGTFREEVVIQTNHPKKPELTVLISGKVEGPITSVPNAVTDYRIDQSKGTTIEVALVSQIAGVEYKVEKAPAQLEVSVKPEEGAAGEGGKRQKLIVRVPPGLEPQQILDEIILKTNQPGSAETLTVHVHFVIQRAADGGA